MFVFEDQGRVTNEINVHTQCIPQLNDKPKHMKLVLKCRRTLS